MGRTLAVVAVTFYAATGTGCLSVPPADDAVAGDLDGGDGDGGGGDRDADRPDAAPPEVLFQESFTDESSETAWLVQYPMAGEAGVVFDGVLRVALADAAADAAVLTTVESFDRQVAHVSALHLRSLAGGTTARLRAMFAGGVAAELELNKFNVKCRIGPDSAAQSGGMALPPNARVGLRLEGGGAASCLMAGTPIYTSSHPDLAGAYTIQIRFETTGDGGLEGPLFDDVELVAP